MKHLGHKKQTEEENPITHVILVHLYRLKFRHSSGSLILAGGELEKYMQLFPLFQLSKDNSLLMSTL